ncbi:MAG: peptidoglycan editing factor PgeF [Oscillospiraceae bacterium]|nr:peptidoglycan editing factor PgeF [Oscillospiraceae bacterium]
MSFETIRKGALEYLVSTEIHVPHCFSTRYGGVSEGHLASLNLGIHRGDKFENVLENYRILGEAVGFRPEDTVFTRQLHTDIVARVGAKDRGSGLDDSLHDIARDGIVTNEPGVALTAFSADCTPILLHDPVKHAIAAVHSGWRGTAAGIVKVAVETLTAEYGTDPADVIAAIGPCIGPCCFETHRDVPDAMLRALGTDALPAIKVLGCETEGDPSTQKYSVDLKEINAVWLRLAGVRTIDICSDCTACQTERFWSHRRVGDRRGSLAAVIMLK